MKVELKISAYVGGILAVAGSVHDLENGADLIEKGLAVDASHLVEVENVDTPTNEVIVAGLNDIEEEDKEFLLKELGDFQLELKKDGTLNAKSLKKIDEILGEEE